MKFVKIHKTDNPMQFTDWFPEIDKKLFTNIRGLEITLIARDYFGRPSKFIFKPEVQSR